MNGLQQYLKENETTIYNYTGTIYGDFDETMTGSEIASMMKSMNGDKDDLVDHPANSGINYHHPDMEEGGFYIQNHCIHYVGYLTDECVFEPSE